MKGFSLSLIVFAMIFLLSSALPEGKKKDHHKTLIESEENKENTKSLQRRKPPNKIPGPTLISEERDSGSLTSTSHDKQSKTKQLSDEDNKKKGKKDGNLKKYNKYTKKDDLAPLNGDLKSEERNLFKDKNFLRGDRHNSDWRKETQEEKSNIH